MVVSVPSLCQFVGAVGKLPKVDLPSSESAYLVTNTELWDKQKAAKKHNVTSFTNLTTALDSPSLIGMLMRAQTTNWPSDKFEPHDMV